MVAKRSLFITVVFILVLTLTACNLPSGAPLAGTPDIEGTVAAKVALEQIAQTMVAQTLSASNPVELESTSTNTIQAPPEFTFTPTLTPTITQTLTPEGVFLTVSQDTYCRFGGPYSSFKVITTVRSGQKVEVISRNPENDSYFVKNPYEAGSTCWLYGKYATLTGNSGALPVSTMHPTPTPTYTPTPTQGFSVSYVGLENCGIQFAFKLFIKNTGSSIWQYISITGIDNDTAFAINHSSNTFKEYTGCVAGTTQADLTPGESSYVLNVSPGQFNYDPTGHNISITVTLCSLDGGAGTCKSIPLSFTP